jgi:hypothetical protein
MIGRIVHAPRIDQSDPLVENWIAAIGLLSDLSALRERWIDPSTVTRIFPVESRPDVIAGFLSDEYIDPANLSDVRQAAYGLWPTLASYRAWRQKRDH